MNKNWIMKGTLLATLAVVSLTACGSEEGTASSGSTVVSSVSEESAAVESSAVESVEDSNTDASTSEASSEQASGVSEEAVAPPTFNFSEGFDENGYWASLKGHNDAVLPQYKGIVVPAAEHTVTDEQLEARVNETVADYATVENVTDRAVKDGDTVNIDYVGSVDGVEFEGGSTGGSGTTVTLGKTSYIEGFLPQLVGKKPGETFDINVTFPDNYQATELAGKAAVFKTTINYIVETTPVDLTDEFVASKLQASHGWKTVEEMKTSLRQEMVDSLVRTYVQNKIIAETQFPTFPSELLDYQERSMISYYQQMAAAYGMKYEDLLVAYLDVENEDAVIEANKAQNEQTAKYMAAFLKIAETENMTVSDADIAAFYQTATGSSDYSEHEKYYGKNYLAYLTLMSKANDLVLENAVLQ